MKAGAKKVSEVAKTIGKNILYKGASLLAKILGDPMDFEAQCNISLRKKNP